MLSTQETPGAIAHGDSVEAPGTRHGRFSARLVADILILVELAGVAFAARIAEVIYETFYYPDMRTEEYILPGVACAAVLFQILRTRGLLGFSAISQGLKPWRSLMSALALAFLIVCAAAFALKISSNYSRGWFLVWVFIAFGWLLTGRAAMGVFAHWLSAAGYLNRRIFVVSAEASEPPLIEAIEHQSGVQLIGHMEIEPRHLEDNRNSVSSALFLADLLESRQRQEVDEIIIVIDGFSKAQLRRLLNELSILSVSVWLHSSSLDTELPIQAIDQIGHMSLLKIKPRPIDGWGYVAKRGCDLALSALALVLLAPLFLMIAAVIRLDSPGPAMFRQRRHGYNEREIGVLKFRTMTVTEDGPVVRQAEKNDTRITRIGSLLRRTSLDELPQLINVVRGDMSLVGPRPHALAHNHYYRAMLQSYGCRHRVKPGITGLAQINGLRGITDSPEKMDRRVRMDIQYIENWSFWLDLKILALTPMYGLFNRNAR